MRREIYKLMSIRALRSFMIIMPILAIYWQGEGLLIRDIFLLQVIYSIAVVVLEVPSGYFADIFGRKGSLVLGVFMGTLGFLLYFLASSFWGFALAEVVLAISAAFLSGADSAFLYDTLQQYASTDQHTKFEGRIISVTRLSEAAAALLCGLLVTFVSFKAIFFWQFVVMALAIPVALALKEPTKPVETTPRKNIFEIFRFVMHENKRLLHLNIFSGFLSAATLTMVWFAQPYWSELQVSAAYFGLMWAGLNIFVSIAAYFSHRLERFFSFRTLFGFFALAPLVLFGLLGLGIGYAALLVIPVFWIVRGLFHPIMLDYVNRETASSIRATVVSASQLFSRLSFAVLSPFLGWVADIWSLEIAFLTSAVVLGGLTFISFLFLYAHMKMRGSSAMVA